MARGQEGQGSGLDEGAAHKRQIWTGFTAQSQEAHQRPLISGRPQRRESSSVQALVVQSAFARSSHSYCGCLVPRVCQAALVVRCVSGPKQPLPAFKFLDLEYGEMAALQLGIELSDNGKVVKDTTRVMEQGHGLAHMAVQSPQTTQPQELSEIRQVARVEEQLLEQRQMGHKLQRRVVN